MCNSGTRTFFPPVTLKGSREEHTFNLSNRKSLFNWVIWLVQTSMWPTPGPGDSDEKLLLELLRKRSFYTKAAKYMACIPGCTNTTWQEVIQMKSKPKKTKLSDSMMYILASSELWILGLKPFLPHSLEVTWPNKFHFVNLIWDRFLLLAVERVMTATSSDIIVLITKDPTCRRNK